MDNQMLKPDQVKPNKAREWALFVTISVVVVTVIVGIFSYGAITKAAKTTNSSTEPVLSKPLLCGTCLLFHGLPYSKCHSCYTDAQNPEEMQKVTCPADQDILITEVVFTPKNTGMEKELPDAMNAKHVGAVMQFCAGNRDASGMCLYPSDILQAPADDTAQDSAEEVYQTGESGDQLGEWSNYKIKTRWVCMRRAGGAPRLQLGNPAALVPSFPFLSSHKPGCFARTPISPTWDKGSVCSLDTFQIDCDPDRPARVAVIKFHQMGTHNPPIEVEMASRATEQCAESLNDANSCTFALADLLETGEEMMKPGEMIEAFYLCSY